MNQEQVDLLDQGDEVQFSEPILPQDNVRCGIVAVKKVEWEIKVKDKWNEAQKEKMKDLLGKKYKALWLDLKISDDTIQTENEDGKPKLDVSNQFNIEAYPYPDKNTGELKSMGKQALYQLEEAFGFDPIFKVNGEIVEPFVTRNNRKVAPKIKGVKRFINPDFFNAYITSDGEPISSNWVGKVIHCKIGVEKSDQYGDKNVVLAYRKPYSDSVIG